MPSAASRDAVFGDHVYGHASRGARAEAVVSAMGHRRFERPRIDALTSGGWLRFGLDYRRLVQLKDRYDPTNLFWLNQSIEATE